MSGPTVFVIDDQKAVRDALAEMLSVFGFAVETFPSADAFLEQIAAPRLGCVVADVRSFMGDVKIMVQMLVMLDDFTEENGATYLLSGSHKQDQKPEEGFFYANADRAVGKKGSIVLFDSNLWHAAGVNQTQQQRRALTLGFTRPFMKQQLDYPRFLGYDYGELLPGSLRQVVGYNARVPADLHEYYQPVEKRMYQRDQG